MYRKSLGEAHASGTNGKQSEDEEEEDRYVRDLRKRESEAGDPVTASRFQISTTPLSRNLSVPDNSHQADGLPLLDLSLVFLTLLRHAELHSLLDPIFEVPAKDAVLPRYLFGIDGSGDLRGLRVAG